MQRIDITNKTDSTSSHDYLLKYFKMSGRIHRHIGSGAFASVYSINGSTARVMKFTDEYDDYLHYVRWIARSGRAYSFMPKVFRVYKCKANKALDREPEHKYDYVREDVNAYAFEIERLYVARTKTQRRLLSQVSYFVEEVEDGYEPTRKDFPLLTPKLINFCRKLVRVCTSHGSGVDAYGDNIRFRANGQLVINDPFA